MQSRSKFQKRGKRYAVLCLDSTFSSLIYTTSYMKLSSKTIEKLSGAVKYNSSLDNKSPFFQNTRRIRKRVPIVRNKTERAARSSDLSPVFLSWLNLIFDGQYAAVFITIVHVLIFGFCTRNNEMLVSHFDSSCIEKKKDFENLLLLAWAKIKYKVYESLKNPNQRSKSIYNELHINSMIVFE